MFDNIIDFIQDIYQTKDFIPLHEPRFFGNEKKYLNECIDSTYVSSVGMFVNEFEDRIANYVGTKYAVSTSSGTSALHVSLLLANVERGDEVITQPLTFVATCNAISYCGAYPVFVDVDRDTMGLSPSSLVEFLESNALVRNQKCINKTTGRVIKACLPMHTFGHPCKVDEIQKICNDYHILLIEDAAEGIGSSYKGRHVGTLGKAGIMSFNGNKIITAGGGGCIVTNDRAFSKRAKHLTTTAKVPHQWNFKHDMVGYNYRMPNLNAALLVAQLENLENLVNSKRKLASMYEEFFRNSDFVFFKEPRESQSNYWLNSILLENIKQRDDFLYQTNHNGVMTRPVWTLMHRLPMFKSSQSRKLPNAEWLEERIVNIPSSPIL